jgi:HlyD family secretion protein
MRKLLLRPVFALALIASGCVIASGCGNNDNPNVITASGTIESTDVNVAAKIPAQIVTLYIDDGTPVDSGSLIAHQDRSALDIQLREAQSALDAARDQQTLTQQGARIEDIKQAEEGVQQAETNRQLATTELDRIKNLLAGGAATKDELDQTETKFKVAQSQLAQAEDNAEKVKHFSRPEEVGEASAHTLQLQAAHDAIQKMIDDSYITSPLKGIVTHKVV